MYLYVPGTLYQLGFIKVIQLVISLCKVEKKNNL